MTMPDRILLTFAFCLCAIPAGVCGRALMARESTVRTVQQGIEQARLELRADRPHALPGGLIEVRVRVVNPSKTLLRISAAPPERTGQLKLFIARGDGSFKEYRGPQWGTLDLATDPKLELAPGRSHETKVMVLWNHRPEAAHLSPLYAKRAAEGRITSVYALPAPGSYRLKAILYDTSFSRRIESAPVDITIDAPKGADRAVWAALQANPDYGYFIQVGEPRSAPFSSESRALVQSLAQLATAYPDSRYADGIRSALARYRQLQARIDAARAPKGN